MRELLRGHQRPRRFQRHPLLSKRGKHGCQELREVKAYQSEPLAINENVFENKAYQNGTLHVPVGCADKFRAAVGWSRFSRIIGDIILPNPADVNGDGEVNMADVNAIISIIQDR